MKHIDVRIARDDERGVTAQDEECDVCAVEGDADCYCPVGNGRCANFKPAAPVAPAKTKFEK